MNEAVMQILKSLYTTTISPASSNTRPTILFPIFSKLALIFGLIASISFVLYTTIFNHPARLLEFPIPTRKPGSEPIDTTPTNITHILFGLGGSLSTWRNRSHFSELWWDYNKIRGFVWLDGFPDRNVGSSIPYQVSSNWRKFSYSSSQSAVRIARIVSESFNLSLPNVRWFVMGDDDTVFFPENLISVLRKYDHNQMWYIGSNSESVEQYELHDYSMAFGGGGFAISYPLAAQLAHVLDGCLDRYFYMYGSDQKVWACIAEIGVPSTKELGFHQFDVRENLYGLLAAHPLAPLVSLHHLDSLEPIFPEQNQTESIKSLIRAFQVDPHRILQQTFCHDHSRRWTISIAWGYTVQIYPWLLTALELQMPLRTFKTWRSSSEGPFTFNTRSMSTSPCELPIVYFLDSVQEVGKEGSLTSYERYGGEGCHKRDYERVLTIRRITVSSMKMASEYWEKAPRRQCCQIMNSGSIRNGSIMMRVRKCRPSETVTI